LLPLPRILLAIRHGIASSRTTELIRRRAVGVWRATSVRGIVLPAIPTFGINAVASLNVGIAIEIVIVVDGDVVVAAAPAAVITPAA
jgi:hypothetical protein